MTATNLVYLKGLLYDIIDLQYDQVLFMPLCDRCGEGIEARGRPVKKQDARDVVVVV